MDPTSGCKTSPDCICRTGAGLSDKNSESLWIARLSETRQISKHNILITI